MGTAQKSQTGNIPTAFGHATSTFVGDNCVIDLYTGFRTIHGMGPFKPDSSEFKGEKLQIHFTVFASFLSTNIIPHRLDHSHFPRFASTNPDNTNYFGFKTIVVYFGKVKEIFRWPISHEDLPKSGAKKDLDPDWYGPLLVALPKKLLHFHLKMSSHENVDMGNDKCLPLYHDLKVPCSKTAKEVGIFTAEDDWWISPSSSTSPGVGDCTSTLLLTGSSTRLCRRVTMCGTSMEWKTTSSLP